MLSSENDISDYVKTSSCLLVKLSTLSAVRQSSRNSVKINTTDCQFVDFPVCWRRGEDYVERPLAARVEHDTVITIHRGAIRYPLYIWGHSLVSTISQQVVAWLRW